MTSSTTATKSTGSARRGGDLPSIRRFSFCARSMILVTRSRRRAEQHLIMPSWRLSFLPASVSSSVDVSPSMPCNGLRISCDSMAIKADLRSWTIFNSVRSERSWPMAMTPAKSPSEVDFGTRLIAKCRTAGAPAEVPDGATTGIAISTSIELPCGRSAVAPSSSTACAAVASSRAAAIVAATALSTLSLFSIETKSVNLLSWTWERVSPVSTSKVLFQPVT
mmetsp:Transcript_58263/g.147741  ORF Transcript_58263/g.147741 Transcript_58263/m.147741 type:complete len:222 (+) Transcript_58263:1792-2457(+)